MPNSVAPRGVVLAVEDEPELLEMLAFNLEKAGYEVLTAASGHEALQQARSHSPDLILLDVMLPGLSGTEVAGRLRGNPQTSAIPILMVTAKAEEVDELVGLTAGADDYITKPYSMKVLIARMEAVLRRAQPAGASERELPPLRFGPIDIDTQVHEARAGGELLKLTLTEFKLLESLVKAKGKVLSRATLMTEALGPGVMVTQRTIDVHITAIRRKLGSYGPVVQTVRGVGYRLNAEQDQSAAQ